MTKVNPFFQTATEPSYIVANRIIRELSEVVETKYQHCAISSGIKACIESHTPFTKIIREIKEMAKDNYPSTAGIIGHHLLLTIVNFE